MKNNFNNKWKIYMTKIQNGEKKTMKIKTNTVKIKTNKLKQIKNGKQIEKAKGMKT